MGIKGRVVRSARCLGRPVVAAGAVVFVVCRNFLASVHGRIIAPHSLSMSGFDFFFFVFFITRRFVTTGVLKKISWVSQCITSG